MALSVAPTILLGLFFGLDAVRIDADVAEDWDRALLPEDQCTEAVSELIALTTYRHLFSPLMPGTYQLRHQGSGKFLSLSGASLKASLTNDENTHWKLGQVTRDTQSTTMLNYTFHSQSSGESLVADGEFVSLGAESPQTASGGVWDLQLNTSCTCLSIAHVETGKFLSISSGRVALADVADYWELVPSSLRKRRWYRGRKAHLMQQWKVVREIPVLPGKSKITWEKACREGEKCSEWYRMERDRHLNHGKTAEPDERDTVTESKVESLCSWTVPGLQRWVHSNDVLKEMQKAVKGKGCPEKLVDFSQVVSVALEDYCFESCGTEMHRQMLRSDEGAVSLPCENSKSSDWESFFTQVIASNTQCRHLGEDVLRSLAEYQMQRRCKTWHPPSLFWVPQDSMPKDNAESLDMRSQCHLEYYDRYSQNPQDIVQEGWCPEGSTCQCPKRFSRNKKSIAEIRSDGRDTYVPDAAAIVPTILAQFQDDLLVEAVTVSIQSVLTNTVVAAVLSLGQIVASYATMTYAISLFFEVTRTRVETRESWTCESSVGCWPVEPVVQRTTNSSRACRLPEAARNGGSPYWFLPPPLLMFSLEPFGCQLRACTETELESEMVGLSRPRNHRSSLGKPNVFNCQPLTFAEMTEEQQAAFAQSLACSGIFEEYDPPKGMEIDISACP